MNKTMSPPCSNCNLAGAAGQPAAGPTHPCGCNLRRGEYVFCAQHAPFWLGVSAAYRAAVAARKWRPYAAVRRNLYQSYGREPRDGDAFVTQCEHAQGRGDFASLDAGQLAPILSGDQPATAQAQGQAWVEWGLRFGVDWPAR
ncbi:MAG: hypothetical protein KKA73_03420 [Chloroflexi bacterium]|nr:hypothetical protein [Chloroflexota bacterium]MBU1746714.1 hypothetical protein [Chloroflexota bacterium]